MATLKVSLFFATLKRDGEGIFGFANRGLGLLFRASPVEEKFASF